MANTLVIKHRKQADAVAPTLTQGEIAANVSDKKFFVGEGAGNIVFADMDYYASTVTDSHTHANKTVLDNTTASFTTADETKIDHITVTQAVDLDAIESDTVLNTTARHTHTNQTVLDNTTASFTTADETKVDYITVTADVDLDEIKNRVQSLDASLTLVGTWDASVGTFPGAGTVAAGDTWIVDVAGTVNGVVFSVNDRVIALQADIADGNSSTTSYANNWYKTEYTMEVLSVGGQTGAVTLADIGLGTAESDITDLESLTGVSGAANLGTFTGTTITDNTTLKNALQEVETFIEAINGSTNLGASYSLTEVTVTSDTGSNISLTAATTGQAGIMTKAMFDEHTANNAKVSNVTTDLSLGTNTGTTLGVNSSDGADITLPAAATGVAGLLSGDDKDKLDGVAPSANNYTLPATVLHDTGLIDGGTF